MPKRIKCKIRLTLLADRAAMPAFLVNKIRRRIRKARFDGDRYFMSPRVRRLKSILAKVDPASVKHVGTPSPAPKPPGEPSGQPMVPPVG
jgi:hypothetical protein